MTRDRPDELWAGHHGDVLALVLSVERYAGLLDLIPAQQPVGNVAHDMEGLARTDHGEPARVGPEDRERRTTDIRDVDAVLPIGVVSQEVPVHRFEAGHVEILDLPRGDCHQIDIAHARVEAAGDRRSVEVQTHEILTQSRSEEHTSELQSLTNLVCRLLLEKK